ncbi:MAG TPA: hypothetical protein VNO26_11745, partial [Candidatus Limnocylindria bacterium]|nr:hypothetical protein [Candidatus Limnocylindria bacterium]
GGMLLAGIALRHYGLDLVDEGTLLAQTERLRTGQWLYRDFHTGYGPASFALNAALLNTFGVRVEVVRVGLAVVHAVTLAVLAVLAGRALGRLAAVVVLALTASFFLPIAPGAFCVWNIPYPSWYAQAAGGLGLLAALATARRGGVALLASGAWWGLAFCCKQNAGVLGMAAVLVWRAFERSERRATVGGRALAVPLAALLGAGALVVVAGGSLGATGSVAVALPVLALAARVATLRPATALVADAVWLAAGFALVVVPVVLGLVWVIGWAPLARQLLHLGSGAAAVYGVAYPGPSEVVGALAGVADGLRGIRKAMDLAWLFLLPAGNLVAALALRPGARTATWRLAVPTAVLAYVQLYPRADFWHLLPVAGMSLVVALGVTLQALGQARAARAVAIALLALAAVRALPNVAVARAALSSPPPGAPVIARAGVRWDLAASPALRAVPEVMAAVAGAPGLVGFPALGIFNFLAGIPSPLRHDYFFPGLLDVAEQETIGREIARVPGTRVVLLRDDVAFFEESFASHPALTAALEREFPVVRRVGPYEVREAAR